MVNLGYLPKKLYSVHVTIDGNKLKYSTKVSNREVSPVYAHHPVLWVNIPAPWFAYG